MYCRSNERKLEKVMMLVGVRVCGCGCRGLSVFFNCGLIEVALSEPVNH